MAIHRHHYRLPIEYYQHVGEIIVEWNHTEALLASIIWKIHRIKDVRKGRTLIYGLNIGVKLKILAQSSKVFSKSPAFHDELSTLMSRANKLKDDRNLMAHGLWGRMENEKLWKVFKMADLQSDLLMIRKEVRDGKIEDLKPDRDVDPRQIAADITALNKSLKMFMARYRIPPP